MTLTDMLLAVLDRSGLRPVWDALAPWLALDERQLIFVIATPVFIAVALWEYLRIRHNPALMDTREYAETKISGYAPDMELAAQEAAAAAGDSHGDAAHGDEAHGDDAHAGDAAAEESHSPEGDSH